MRILGIDPGLIRTGYGMIESAGPADVKLLEAGVITTDSADGISVRIKDIFNSITDVIKDFSPDVLVLEKIYSHYKHPTTSILMGHARGVICLACGLNDIKLINLPATRVKKAVTGNGRASKSQVQGSVKALLGLGTLPEPVDISDALAIAISYVFMGMPENDVNIGSPDSIRSS